MNVINKHKKFFKKHKNLVEVLAKVLSEKETLTKEEIDYLVTHKCLPDEDSEIGYTDFKEASLDDLTLDELKDLAKEKNIKGYSKMNKKELLDVLKDSE